ncbi:3-dehydroquinate synthase [Bacillus sp. FJAT-29790]|uniref:3-dehydroquinate synthase n=1 Tax=Bacillus sp. FJAT-29790 TaxID=1895002 RepID=UPI001C22BF8F|nr:3-dehydroquinate synthase [Bacillus sp. FJAT-29790]MBU8879095.1 3-dehydroquinate synthase [Bacillus sp. FJAT-29790]
MKEVSIQTNSKTYPVYIGAGVINQLTSFIKGNYPSLTNIILITDETVASHYLPAIQNVLSEFDVKSCIVPSGEKAKTFDVYYRCLSFCLEEKLDRKSVLLSFGGGAVGDLGGFVAATYMRGIPFIQVPTTILAHDSAVGGKVAINHPLGKNMIGAFHQPDAVFYDLNFLASLPLSEKRSGFAEVIKHGLIKDPLFYIWLREHIHSLDEITEQELNIALTKGIEIKGAFVSQDEKETGVRAFLNFGHTLGHAIEAEMGYGNCTHGEAVAVGMLFALELSKKIYDLPFAIEEFKEWLSRLGYEISIPKELANEKLLERMKQDKKSIGQKIRFVLLKHIGEPVLYEFSDEELLIELGKFQGENI